MGERSVREMLRVTPGEGPVLAAVDPDSTPGIGKKRALRQLAEDSPRLAEFQERLFAEGTRSILLVLQGMDTSGKDGTIKHVIGGMNPVGCRIVNFKQPTPEERRHNYLWRIRRGLPKTGEVGIFNRSHYEDVLVVRVKRLVPKHVLASRYEEINRFESRVVAGGTALLKVCLHISYDEQRERLLERLEDPNKRWKFKEGDLAERARWGDYQAAYEDALTRCSTEAAPWYVVPADRKWYRNWAVARLLIETLEEMDPVYPRPPLDVARLKARLAPPN